MKLINETVLEFSNRDDLRTIELDYSGKIRNEYDLSQILINLDYDFSVMTYGEDVQVFYNGYKDKFHTNGFDLLSYLKANTKLRY